MEGTAMSAQGARSVIKQVFFGVAVLMSLFQLFAAASSYIETMPLRSMHLCFTLVLIFLLQTEKRTGALTWKDGADLVCALLSVAVTVYAFLYWEDMTVELVYPSELQLAIGCTLIAMVMYATGRSVGWAIPLLALCFLLYAFFGQHIPPPIGHRGLPFDRIIGGLTMATEGIYGLVLGVSATYIFLFVLFGAFMEKSGASDFFINISLALFGKRRGGPAKVAVMASGIMGTISGSAVANVCTTGVMTIPMMKKAGYESPFAGGVEAVASTGGQIMPPIMGAAAFIMAETLSIPYISVCKAAIIPALMYYVSLWFMVDLNAQKRGIKPLSADEVPDWRPILAKGFLLAVPLVLLIICLSILLWSPLKSGLLAILSLLVVSSLRKDTRLSFKKLCEILAAGAQSCLTVAIICAIAGIIIGVLTLTGLGIKFSQLLIALSFGVKPVLLVLTMLAGLILGMGMTATSVYIIISVLIAPALVEMGTLPIAAHLFAFYFGILSAITPPVAIASFAAAGICKASPNKVGYQAWLLGCAGFIIPFMFLYNPVLLLEGNSIPRMLYSLFTAFLGIFCMACAVEGWLVRALNPAFRLILLAVALLLIDSGLLTDALGFFALASIYIFQKATAGKKLLPTLG